ncbi:MAG: HAMP domain-containing sensor histidine kinase [Eubacteriales bacterium]|nr:HAMP domain-containing sensor histidine kinase [Eubacteriales bacterium]
MERLKQMSLKKAFFCLTLLFLLIALILSIFSILGISKIMQQYGTSLEMKIDGSGIIIPPATAAENDLPLWYHVLAILQFALPVLFVITGLLSADLLFYRIKLKKPLVELQAGAERIMQNDLDFSIQSISKDELGQLCNAFEEMRLELLKTNRELWQQMEERKRLNAAFSHDLRNPVTVLKGSAKILKKRFSNGTLSSQNAQDSILLIEEYAGRIETYIEAMSSVQRLEELQCSPKNISLETVIKELSECIHLLTMDTGITAEEQFDKQQRIIWIDKAIVFNVAENLIENAARYAKAKIQIDLTLDAVTLVLSVKDDGSGFPQAILQKGAEPFLRGDESNEHSSHFGMGLYVCRLLCEKHNGSLSLQNTGNGALAIARFKISKT